MADEREHERELAALRDYVRLLADRMGLKDWTFEVECVPDEVSEAYAPVFLEVIVPETLRQADVFVSGEFFDELPERRRLLLVEQLLFCHTETMTNFVLDQFDRIDDRGGPCKAFQGHFDAAMTPIATAWAPFLPLPLVGLMKHARAQPAVSSA